MLALLVSLQFGSSHEPAFGQRVVAPPPTSSSFARRGDRLVRTQPAPLPLSAADGYPTESEIVVDPEMLDPSGPFADPFDDTPSGAAGCWGSMRTGRGGCLAPPFGSLLPFGGLAGRGGDGWWIRAEALAWWIGGNSIPPLVTASSIGTPRDEAGRLDQATTTILFGDGNSGATFHPGVRIRLGYWLDSCQTHGLEASYYGLAERSETFSTDSSQFAILARPFFNVEPPAPGADAELVAFPNLMSGGIQVRRQTELRGFELVYRRALCQDCDHRVDWLVGYRYLGLDEQFAIADHKRIIAAGTGMQLGTTIDESDQFTTQNDFHGVEIGMMTARRRNGWSVEACGKLAFGSTHSLVGINGATTVTVPAPDVATTPFGLLALPSNSGTYSRDAFAVIPEFGVTLGYDVTSCLRATVGYTLLYWGAVARPGEQIDLDANLSQLKPGGLVGAPRPEFRWIGSDAWIQGLNAGLNYRF